MTFRPPALLFLPTSTDQGPMDRLPEFTWIVLLLAFFFGVFVVSNLLARVRGSKE
jgi:hypothetical protein